MGGEGILSFGECLSLLFYLLIGGERTMGSIILHELLHTYGGDHVKDDPENLMTPTDGLVAPYLSKAQCEMLVKQKTYRMGFLGRDPWE